MKVPIELATHISPINNSHKMFDGPPPVYSADAASGSDESSPSTELPPTYTRSTVCGLSDSNDHDLLADYSPVCFYYNQALVADEAADDNKKA